MKDLIVLNYEGKAFFLNEDGWFNATKAAEVYGRRVDVWLKTEETQRYITVLMEFSNTTEKCDLIRTKKGHDGGTWLHPSLAVVFARWLDTRFAILCDIKIAEILHKDHPHFNWKRARHESTSSFKVMSAVLQLMRQNEGKQTQSFHYANEAKLVNWAITGEFKPLDRDSLSIEELDLLAKLEERNAVLVGCGFSRDDRKAALLKFAEEYKSPKQIAA